MSAAPQLAEELFNEHHRRIYLYCLRQLGSPEEAEDAVQATYLNACRSLKDGFEPEAAQAWLFKVAHNVCLTRQRSSYRRARVERPQDLQAVQDVVAAPEASGDELFGLDEALAGLPEQQRNAILLREWQGLSYREVAAKLGVTQAAVETLIFRARRSLADSLEQPVEAPAPLRALPERGRAPQLSQDSDRRQRRGERRHGRRRRGVGNGVDRGDDPARRRLPLARHSGAAGRQAEARRSAHPARRPGAHARRGRRLRVGFARRRQRQGQGLGRDAPAGERQGQAEAREQGPPIQAPAGGQLERARSAARPGEVGAERPERRRPRIRESGKKG